MKRPRTLSIRSRTTTSTRSLSRGASPYDDRSTCPVCFGPTRRHRCLLCGAISAPRVVVRHPDGSVDELLLADLLAGRWSS